MAKPKVHRTAIVDPGAKLAEGVEIGPYSIIGKGVKIGKNSKIHAHVIIEDTDMGSNNTVYPFTSIGLPPQDLKYSNEKTRVKIGSNNIIREYVSINKASADRDKVTKIGSNNFFMAYVHIAHDCIVGNKVILANATTLAGHVTVEDSVFIGGLVAVHQFARIGASSMIGGFSAIAQDIPPFTTAAGSRAKLYGLNSVGLKRQNFDEATIKNLKRAYKVLFRSKLTLKEAITMLKSERKVTEEINYLIEFIEQNKRGVCR
jgi:UDP-N-acetylglucosamine acyltransferase